MFHTKLHYLGHVINKESIQPDPKLLAAVREKEQPKQITGVGSFVAFCYYHRKIGFANKSWLLSSPEAGKPLAASYFNLYLSCNLELGRIDKTCFIQITLLRPRYQQGKYTTGPENVNCSAW